MKVSYTNNTFFGSLKRENDKSEIFYFNKIIK